jgi:hypothetical protein
MTTLINRTGYELDSVGNYIRKDPTARLTYFLDWSEWMPSGDTIASVNYTVQNRLNDPNPIVVLTQGFDVFQNVTYIEIQGGGVGKIYSVTADIVTTLGLEDRRAFRVKVENRQA